MAMRKSTVNSKNSLGISLGHSQSMVSPAKRQIVSSENGGDRWVLGMVCSIMINTTILQCTDLLMGKQQHFCWVFPYFLHSW